MLPSRKRLGLAALGGALAVGALLAPGGTTYAAWSDFAVIHASAGAGVWAPDPPAACGSLSDYKGGVIYGTPGPDVLNLSSSNQRQIVMGYGGDDVIYGGNSGDCLVGGPGNDRITGGNAQDILLGEDGDDVLDGGNGKDVLDSGAGADTCIGGNGKDTISCGSGGLAAALAPATTTVATTTEAVSSPAPSVTP